MSGSLWLAGHSVVYCFNQFFTLFRQGFVCFLIVVCLDVSFLGGCSVVEAWLACVWEPYWQSLTEEEQERYLKKWDVPSDWRHLYFEADWLD